MTVLTTTVADSDRYSCLGVAVGSHSACASVLPRGLLLSCQLSVVNVEGIRLFGIYDRIAIGLDYLSLRPTRDIVGVNVLVELDSLYNT